MPKGGIVDRQRELPQQNSATRSKIAECARRFADGDPALSWLGAVLEARGIKPSKGILAAYSERPDQDKRLCTGSWLTVSGDFWEFQALVPVAGEDRPAVKFFDERSVSVFAHERGIAKSFGALAIEVRDEILGR
jgi:hypothetical protein